MCWNGSLLSILSINTSPRSVHCSSILEIFFHIIFWNALVKSTFFQCWSNINAWVDVLGVYHQSFPNNLERSHFFKICFSYCSKRFCWCISWLKSFLFTQIFFVVPDLLFNQYTKTSDNFLLFVFVVLLLLLLLPFMLLV